MKSNRTLKIGFLLTFISFVTPNIVYSQFGIKAGVTTSNFYYTDRQNIPDLTYEIDLRPFLGHDIEWIQLNPQKPLVTPFIGTFYRLQISKGLYFMPEMGFMQKGVSFSNYDYERILYKVKITYLDIPVSIGYQFIRKEKISAIFYLGGFGDFKLNAIKKVAVHNSPVDRTKISTLKNTEAGWLLGLDLKTPISEKNLIVDIRAFQGLNGIFTIPDGSLMMYDKTQKTKITGFKLGIGYEF